MKNFIQFPGFILQSSALSAFFTILAAPFVVLFFLLFIDFSEFQELANPLCIFIGWEYAVGAAIIQLVIILIPFSLLKFNKLINPEQKVNFFWVYLLTAIGAALLQNEMSFSEFGQGFEISLLLANFICTASGVFLFQKILKNRIRKINFQGSSEPTELEYQNITEF